MARGYVVAPRLGFILAHLIVTLTKLNKVKCARQRHPGNFTQRITDDYKFVNKEGGQRREFPVTKKGINNFIYKKSKDQLDHMTHNLKLVQLHAVRYWGEGCQGSPQEEGSGREGVGTPPGYREGLGITLQDKEHTD